MSLPDRQRSSVALPSGRGRFVLVVDDSASHRDMITTHLEQAGYEVAQAADCLEAMDICSQREPDLILCDHTTSRAEAARLIATHRRQTRRQYGYVILILARGEVATLANGLPHEADDFLVKPVSAPELVARLIAGERIIDMHAKLIQANRELRLALTRLRRAQQTMERDLAEAGRLQQGLIRDGSGRFERFQMSLLLRPAGMVGGDLVRFQPLGPDRVGFYAIDVSGHGVTAALLAARLAAELSWDESRGPARDPLAVVNDLNRMMLRDLRTDVYMTMVYGELHLPTGEIRLVQAGHPYPLLQRRDGSIESVGEGGPPVGVFTKARFEEIRLTLAPGDRLLIASDGVTDAAGHRGELLGEEGLRAILQLNAPLIGPAMLESLSWSVSEYASGDRNDDISAVLVEHLDNAQILRADNHDESS